MPDVGIRGRGRGEGRLPGPAPPVPELKPPRVRGLWLKGGRAARGRMFVWWQECGPDWRRALAGSVRRSGGWGARLHEIRSVVRLLWLEDGAWT